MPSHMLVDSCGQCGQLINLLRCTGCQAMFYCSREHQVAHRNTHKYACKEVLKTREKCQEEELKIRNTPDDNNPFGWGNAFETAVGHFWGILDTRDYMRARFAWAEALGKMETKTGIEEKLAHSLDMLRLCRGDNMGLRSYVPALMLRLNKDQECYDFVKWWFVGCGSDYDWGNMDLPYLDIKDADVFEEVEYFTKDRWSQLGHLVALTLLKIKLILDLEALQSSTHTVGAKVPREVLDDERSDVPLSPVIARNQKLVQSDDHTEPIKKLRHQVNQLYQSVNQANGHFWDTLLLSDEIPEYPGAYSHGSIEEAELTLGYTYDAWRELPAALEFVRTLQA
ncbi:hypothetical protein BJY00DRAFT_293512 [Aspergillus carlsbadensis]|nr:hypothetical protein BJY00DRAFT_293512 [Aspergillus carlsbadensis]